MVAVAAAAVGPITATVTVLGGAAMVRPAVMALAAAAAMAVGTRMASRAPEGATRLGGRYVAAASRVSFT